VLETYEIGSLAKPAWRVKALRGLPIAEADVEEAARWGSSLGVEGYRDLVAVLRGEDSEERRRRVVEWSAIYAIKLLEAAGLDYVFDGEQWRSEMYDHFVRRVKGMAPIGEVRSFDNKYYTKASAIGPVDYKEPIYLDEFLFTKENARRRVKVPIIGAYTLVDWSFNEYYLSRQKGKDLGRARREARREMALEMASKVIRREVRALADAGAEWIQIDEPAAAAQPEEVSLVVETFNESARGINCKFSVHICFSDYSLLFPAVLEMKGCDQFAWEFANRDSRNLGTGDGDRPGYEALRLLREYDGRWEVGLGVADVHVDYLEPPELIRDRILYASRVLSDPSRIYVNPDCGLRTRTWEVAFAKLQNLVAGARLARRELE